jgi:hypothetical protein
MKIELAGAACLAALLCASSSGAQEPAAPPAQHGQIPSGAEAHATSPPPAPPAAKPDEISHEAMVEEQERRDREEQAERDRDDQT